jgi:hypothetical protein
MIEGKDDKPPQTIFNPKLEDWKDPPKYFDEENTDRKKILRLEEVSLPERVHGIWTILFISKRWWDGLAHKHKQFNS